MLKDERAESYRPTENDGLDGVLYDKYKAEFYGTLCALTSGEAEDVIKGASDFFGISESSGDGYKALVMLSR